jgi:hypothetical protein
VKTPGPQRAAGRRQLAARKQALPGGSFPIPDVAYLKKAIRSVGRAPASKRPALKALIRKRARELKAANTPGVKGTWPFQAANTHGKVVDLAMATMTRKMPVVRGAADVQLTRSGPGKVTVMHKSTGFKVGTLGQAGKGWQGVHASGAKTPPSGSMGGAVAGLVATHNQLARGKKLPPAQQDGTATYAHPAGDGIDLAGALPHSTPASSASDGPRVTTAGGSGPAGLTGEAAAVYAKLIKKGLKPGQAAALARRAAAMHAKAADPKASAA